MAALLEKYRKVAGTGPGSTINLDDWNGLIDELSTTLAGLVKKGADFDAVATVAIGVLLDRINNVLGPAYDQVSARGAQIEALYAQISGTGISANSVIESATRLFLTDARRAAILAELRGGVPSGGDTLMELYTAIQGALAAIQAIPGDVVRYGTAQTLSVGSAIQAKANIRADGTGRRYIIGAPGTVTPADVGKLIYCENNVTGLTVGKASDFADGDTFWIYARGTVTVQKTAGDPYTFGFADFNRDSFVMRPGDRCKMYMGADAWDVVSYTTAQDKALMVDRAQTFSDAEIKQLLINANINSGIAQCRLEYVSPTECRVKGVGGNKVLVDGVVRTIPKDGVPISNAGLTANTGWYLYLAWDGSKLICFGQPYVPAIDPTSGMACSSAYTYHLYMGKVYIDASGQFKDSPGTRFVLTHYNKRWRGIRGPVGTYSTSSSSASVELSTGARAFLCLDGANGASTILIGLAGTGGAGATSPGYGIYTAPSLNGVDYTPTALAGNAAYGNSDAGGMDTVEAGDGLHYVTIKGQTNGNYTASVTGCVVGMVLM